MAINIKEHPIGWLPTFDQKSHSSKLDPTMIHASPDLDDALAELQKAVNSARSASKRLFIVNKVWYNFILLLLLIRNFHRNLF